MFAINNLKNHDLIILLLLIPITIIGLANVFSTTFFPDLKASADFTQQIVFFVFGLALLYLPISILDKQYVKQHKSQLLFFILTTGMLLFTLLTADPELGPARWIRLGLFSFQPSEFAKLFIIISTAITFSDIKRIDLEKIPNLYKKHTKSSIMTLLRHPLALRVITNILFTSVIVVLILIQPSLGNALITLGLWLIILASLLPKALHALLFGFFILVGINIPLGIVSINGLSGLNLSALGVDLFSLALSIGLVIGISLIMKLSNIFTIIAISTGIFLGLASGYIWQNVLTEYQQDRVVSFVNPESDPRGAGWQVSQAKVAIASGQIFGKGYLQGTQSNYKLLPYAYTDFAYAAFVEQFGTFGALVLFLLYQALVVRILIIANRLSGNFERIICIGVAAMITINIVINIGMNLGIMPVTGVPLPLISYGGSAVLVNLIGLGLVQMVHSSSKQLHHSENLVNIEVNNN